MYYPLPRLHTLWHIVHIDFITNLPVDEGCSTIMTVVDRFSKICSFVPLNSTIAASAVATLFKEVVVHHGLQRQIVGDHDPQFTSDFWHCLMSTLKTNVQFSTLFHPQMGDMAEVSN